MVKIGDKIETFSTQSYLNDKIKDLKLADYKGKWIVLLFYPADFTFVCPTELEEAAINYQSFKKNDAEIMSVSTDTAYSHKAWHDSSDAIKKIKYPMLADPTGKLCRYFGTYIEKEGLSTRATFIINPKLEIVSMELHDNSIGRNIHEILRKLQAAQFVYKHKTKVCPASWQPGKKTLTPSEKLVGKI